MTNFGFELFTTTSREGGQFGSTWLQGKPRFRTNEERVLQRDPVENLNEVILSLLHYIRIEQSCLTSDKSHELFDFWSKIGPKVDLSLSK